MKAFLQVEQLEDRNCPVVHSFSAGSLASGNPAAGGTAATRPILDHLGGSPVPVFASAGHANGVPFSVFPPSVPGRK